MMKIYLDAKQFTYYEEQTLFQNAVFVIGKLDGLHQGHQRIIQKAYQEAQKNHYALGVFTFHPHPLHLFQKEHKPQAIYSLQDKYALLESLGVNCVLDQYFDLPFANLSPEGFVSEILCQKLRVKKVFVGYDFAFAKKRSGTLDILKQLAVQYDFEVDISQVQSLSSSEIEACGAHVTEEQRIFASSTIRHWLYHHQIKLANTALGRYFHIWGKVVHGFGRGRKLGFPTANLQIESELIPAPGVYCSWLKWEGQEIAQPSIVNIGLNPTFKEEHLLKDTQKYAVEVHVFSNQDLDLYGKRCCLYFVDFMRLEQKFESIESLKKQIASDCENAQNMLSLSPLPSWPISIQ